MKKALLSILLLSALFISCSSDDDNDPDNGNQNGKDMIDEKIIGKWKVEYSKTIKGARFLEDGTLEIAENAVITEYDGKLSSDIVSGIFDYKEAGIEIKDNNTIIAHPQLSNSKTIYYKIENGLLKWVTEPVKSTSSIVNEHKYKLENGKLIIERIPTSKYNYKYTISEYSKIKE